MSKVDRIITPSIRDWHTCAVCGVRYNGLEAAGRWECRQHSGVVRDGRFTCCNMDAEGAKTTADFYRKCTNPNRMGCIECEHRPEFAPFTEANGTFPIGVSTFKVLQYPPVVVEKIDEDRNEVVIMRYNKRRMRAAETVMLMHHKALKARDGPIKKFVLKSSFVDDPTLLRRMLNLLATGEPSK